MLIGNESVVSMEPWIGLGSAGPGVAGYKSWIVAFVVVIGLAALAWWTLRPTRRATRAEVRRARPGGRGANAGSDDRSQP